MYSIVQCQVDGRYEEPGSEEELAGRAGLELLDRYKHYMAREFKKI